jgi:hypothetical protein
MVGVHGGGNCSSYGSQEAKMERGSDWVLIILSKTLAR